MIPTPKYGDPVALLARLEKQKRETLEYVKNWPEARLADRPAPDAWSVIEVLDHIVKVECEIIGAARRGMREPHRIGLRDRLGFFLVDRVFRSRRRVKVPTSASQVLPDRNVSLDFVLQRWEASRQDLAQLLTEITPGQLRAGVFRHPVSGWMSLPQILRFFSVHLQHHGFQLSRLNVAFEAR